MSESADGDRAERRHEEPEGLDVRRAGGGSLESDAESAPPTPTPNKEDTGLKIGKPESNRKSSDPEEPWGYPSIPPIRS